METQLGTCPWCDTAVRTDGTGGMQPVQESLVVDEPRWWHQGCVFDMTRARVEADQV